MEGREASNKFGVIFRRRGWVGSPGLLRFDLGFINKHYGNIVLDGVDSPALSALQTLTVRRKFHGKLTKRADQNVQELLIDGHGVAPTARIRNLPDAPREYKQTNELEKAKYDPQKAAGRNVVGRLKAQL